MNQQYENHTIRRNPRAHGRNSLVWVVLSAIGLAAVGVFVLMIRHRDSAESQENAKAPEERVVSTSTPTSIPAAPARATRQHALLFSGGTRFETISSDGLAFHGPITIAFWVKVARIQGGVLEIKLNNFSFWIRRSALQFLVQSAHSVAIQDLDVGRWRHVAGTFDGSTTRLFVDGVEVANTRAWLAGNSIGRQVPIVIREANEPAPIVLVDDLRVWAQARTSEEIRSDFDKRFQPAAEPGLVAAFDFNEGQGQAVQDKSQNGYSGWLGSDPARPDPADPSWTTDTYETPEETVPEVTRYAACRGGNCSLVFIDLGQVTTADVQTLVVDDNRLTLEAWVRVEVLPTNPLEIVRLRMGIVPFYFYLNRKRLSFVMGSIGLNVTELDLQGAWHHIACTYDGTIQAIYVDGMLVASEEVSDDSLTRRHRRGQVIIGKAREPGAVVLIDDVRVWKTPRTADEIRTSLSSELVGNEPGLIGYWTFNEASGQSARDRSPFGHHAWLGSSPIEDNEDPFRAQEAPPLRR